MSSGLISNFLVIEDLIAQDSNQKFVRVTLTQKMIYFEHI